MVLFLTLQIDPSIMTAPDIVPPFSDNSRRNGASEIIKAAHGDGFGIGVFYLLIQLLVYLSVSPMLLILVSYALRCPDKDDLGLSYTICTPSKLPY